MSNSSGIDGRAVGIRMAVGLIHESFNRLAVGYAAADRAGALAALTREEIFLADAIEEFRQRTGTDIAIYNDAFEAMIEMISSLIEGARDAIERGRDPAEK